MATTQLFVELLVIGFGALLWLALLGAALLGCDLTSLVEKSQSLWALPPLLSAAYVFGILIDRVADWIFESQDRRHLKKHFGTDRDGYYAARRILVVHGPQLWAHLEYGRSRLRICRGWALNGVLLLASLDVFAYTCRPAALTPLNLVVCHVFLVALCGLCVACWWTLNEKEYLKIDRQSAWIEKMKNKEGSDDGGAG